MRVSTNWLFQQGVNTMLGNQAALARTQEQVGSGRKLQTPSEDPIAAARITDIQRSQIEVEQWQRNTLAAQNRLTLSEGALADSSQILQRLRELAVQGNNATLDATTRRTMVAEVEQLGAQLVQLANASDVDGQHLFGGTTNGSEPFLSTPGGVQYLGDDQQRMLALGPASRIADSETGSRVFMNVRAGNGLYSVTADAANTGQGIASLGPAGQGALVPFTLEFGAGGSWQALDDTNAVIATGTHQPGETIMVNAVRVRIDGTPAAGDQFEVQTSEIVSVFDMVDRMARALDSYDDQPASRAQFHSEMNATLGNLEQALGNVIDARSRVGARLGVVEQQINLNADNQVQMERYLSELRDVDYASAISRMNQQMVALQAAQQSFVRVTSLNLFNYL